MTETERPDSDDLTRDPPSNRWNMRLANGLIVVIVLGSLALWGHAAWQGVLWLVSLFR